MQESADFWTILTSIIIFGLPATLLLTGLGLIFGFLLGLGLALMRVYGVEELKWIADGYEKIMRGIPILVLMFIFGWALPGFFFFLPAQLRTLAGVILSLSLRSAAYQSQLYRGAILSVSEGQMQAARSIGMSTMQASRHIVLPQALRIAIPGFSNEYAVVIKDSAFASAVGVPELFRLSRSFSQIYPDLWIMIMFTAAIIYLIFTYPITKIVGERMTKRLKALGLGGG
ncbi:ABC transporter permease subunit [Candidatus Thorarchaeota archaeon]|nr:MAG: ABC transporter permease subunit [Candidatus Thorarchaeota archaeon]